MVDLASPKAVASQLKPKLIVHTSVYLLASSDRFVVVRCQTRRSREILQRRRIFTEITSTGERSQRSRRDTDHES